MYDAHFLRYNIHFVSSINDEKRVYETMSCNVDSFIDICLKRNFFFSTLIINT